MAGNIRKFRYISGESGIFRTSIFTAGNLWILIFLKMNIKSITKVIIGIIIAYAVYFVVNAAISIHYI
ncbi:MAG: hypothetical protein PHS30_11670, partial [Bacteroidales bacterium]|nr:hypothetical protein [Bacteroidales bacterium]